MRKRSTLSPLVLMSVLIVGVAAFVGGQAMPRLIPAHWSIGHEQINFDDLNVTYELLDRKFDGNIDKSKIMDGARAGLVSAAGDPYTVYLDAKAAKELEDQLTGTLSGIGAEVGIKNNRLTVIAPIGGSPAEKAGLLAGDYIAGIDKKDTTPYTVDEAVSKIRGKEGTKVTLTVVRGATEPKEIVITRAVISVPSVTWSMKPGNVGYIDIGTFGSDTSDKIVQAARELKAQGATKFVLDMRNNPGGYMEAAVAVSSQFMPAGKTVVEEKKEGRTQQKLDSYAGGELVGKPVVILINGGSASASEITAGALRDQIKAPLIGEKSFGKGSVQDITKIGGGAEVKITVAHWFTPSGKGIDKVGIKPDIEVKQTTEDFNANRDPQLDRALLELAKK